jgi:AraC-like DNA-binding protein
MIALRTARPNPILQEFVRVYAQREVGPSESRTEVLVETIPARLEQILEFQFGEPFHVLHWRGHSELTPKVAVIGAQVQGCSRIELKTGIHSFGVFFRPAGFSRLIGLPVSELAHRNYDGPLISRLLSKLWDQLAECGTFHQRVRVIEEALLSLVGSALPKEPMIDMAERVFSLRGQVRISELALQTGVGVRQFERRFSQTIGMPPKFYARVARFQSALDAKIAQPTRSWLDIAHDLEYHDQMHMIRDFQLLGGGSPSHILARIGDIRPVALFRGEQA